MSAVRRLAGGLLLALAILGWGAGAAWAYWTTSGTGTGTATTATLNPPTGVTASATPGSGTILVAWTTPSGDLAPQGYVVRRSLGSSTVVVCGSPTPVTDTSCTDQPVLAGTYTYTVTAVYNSWTATSAGVEITPDRTAPRVIGVASATANGAYRAGDEILVEVAFSETVTVGGTPQLDLRTSPTGTTAASYVSGSGTSVLTFRYTVAAGDTSIDLDYASTSSLTGTISDDFGNPATLGLPTPGAVGSLGANANLVIDTTPPLVPVPGVPADPITTLPPSVAITLEPASDDGGSGVDTTTLERAAAAFTDGACGPFGSPTTIALVGGADTAVTSGACYQYRQMATDRAGNLTTSSASAVVRVDTTAPDMVGLAFGPFVNASATGTTVYYRPTASGSFTVTPSATDPQSGVVSFTYPPIGAGWTTSGTNAGTFSWAAGASPGSSPFPITARNGVGLTSTAATFALVADTVAPAVPVPNVPSTVPSLSVPVGLGTVTDLGSGVDASSLRVERASAPITNGVCGTVGNFSAVTLVGGVDTTVSDGSCYQYRQQAADKVGNVSAWATSGMVKVDVRPRVLSVALSNAGAAGTIGRGDAITIVFSETMRASSMCAAWNGASSAAYSIAGNGEVTVTVLNGVNGADYVEVTSAAGCTGGTAGFGRLTLGRADLVSSDTIFRGNGNNASELGWNGATNTLTIRLGSGNGVTAPATSITSYSNGIAVDLDNNGLATPFPQVQGGW